MWGDEARTSLRDFAELPARLLLVEASAMPAAWQWTGMAMGGLVWLGLGLGAWQALRAPRGIGAAAAALFATIAIALLLALVAKNFLPRYLTAAAPLLVMVMAEGLAALRWRKTGAIAGAFVAIVLVALTVVHRTANRREDYRSACALVEQRWQAGDEVVAVSGTPELFSQAALRHYLRARQDIVASLRPIASWPEQGNAPRAVHVVYRVNDYARPDLQRVSAGRSEAFTAPVQWKIQYRELR